MYLDVIVKSSIVLTINYCTIQSKLVKTGAADVWDIQLIQQPLFWNYMFILLLCTIFYTILINLERNIVWS